MTDITDLGMFASLADPPKSRPGSPNARAIDVPMKIKQAQRLYDAAERGEYVDEEALIMAAEVYFNERKRGKS